MRQLDNLKQKEQKERHGRRNRDCTTMLNIKQQGIIAMIRLKNFTVWKEAVQANKSNLC